MHSSLERPFCFVGVVHLLALPAGPRPSLGFTAVRERALRDADALANGGADAVIVENYGDAPFPAGPVDPHVTAFVGTVCWQIRERFPSLAVGVNLLRNDVRGSIGTAAAGGAAFVRANVHAGSMWTDQGLLHGDAHHSLRYRQELGADVAVAADVLVKHAAPPTPVAPGRIASDLWHRSGADVLIVTGEGTGRPADAARLAEVRLGAPTARIWVGSGVDLDSAGSWRRLCDGAIVGTTLHAHGRIGEPVELARVRAMRAALDEG